MTAEYSVPPVERAFKLLRAIAAGHTATNVSETARELKLSVKTVEKHRANLMRKLSLHNAADITRFAKVGQFASYARCVDSQRVSNGKKKGEGNAKCGNPYLAWAFVEAAHFAVRYNARVRRFYERKAAKTNKIVAIKATAHKLARAAYHVMRERVPFDETRAFA